MFSEVNNEKANVVLPPLPGAPGDAAVGGETVNRDAEARIRLAVGYLRMARLVNERGARIKVAQAIEVLTHEGPLPEAVYPTLADLTAAGNDPRRAYGINRSGRLVGYGVRAAA